MVTMKDIKPVAFQGLCLSAEDMAELIELEVRLAGVSSAEYPRRRTQASTGVQEARSVRSHSTLVRFQRRLVA